MSTNVKKKSTAGGAGKFSYKYTDLATIHEEMEKQGITYYQYTKYDENAHADYVYTVITKDGKVTEPIRGAKIVEGNTLAGGNAAQQYGSALTYARRYSLLMALGWATEDDDAQSAGSTYEPQKIAPRSLQNNGRLDFDAVREELAELHAVEAVEALWRTIINKYQNLTDKQYNALTRMFKDRKDDIEAGEKEPRGWQPERKA